MYILLAWKISKLLCLWKSEEYMKRRIISCLCFLHALLYEASAEIREAVSGSVALQPGPRQPFFRCAAVSRGWEMCDEK